MSNNFRKTKTAKAIAGFVGLTTGLMMIGGTALSASAQTAGELAAQINSLLATITSLQAQLNTLQGGTTTTTTVSGYTFTRNLKLGMTGEDVRQLQMAMNADTATAVAFSGVGSAGSETTYFGGLTKAAVIKFQNKYASEVLTPVGLSAGTGYVGPSTRDKLNSMSTTVTAPVTTPVTTTPVATGADLSVTLSSDTPLSTALIQAQAIADMAHFSLSNTTAADVTVTKITLNRIGVSADATLANVYLFDGVNRLTDSATVSGGVITFNNASGILTIPSGTTMVISVKSDIAGSTSGEIVGVSLASIEASAPVSGSFPISGNTHTIASATLAGVDFNTTTTPSANTSLEPQDEYVMWQNTVSVSTRSAFINSFSLRMIGSAQTADLGNFKLYVGGVQVGNTVAQLDSDGFVTFDLSTSPVELKAGNRIIKMVGDVIGGSSRNFKFSLRQSSDVNVTDEDYGANIRSTANGSSFSVREGGQQDISSGTLTITKMTDSPSGNINLDASGALLAKFQLKAAGEAMKVENLYVNVQVNSSASTTVTLRNGALYADGVQVGSTASLESASAGTQYTFGSSLIVNPGSPVTLEVRADIYDDDGTNDLIATDTLEVQLIVGSSNVQQMTSFGYVNSAATNANTVTIVTGSMSLAKYSAYANQTVVVPQTAYKIGEFRLTADETEDVTINTITLALNNGGTGLSATSTDITNLYVVYGGNTTSEKASGANSQSWSISKTLSANTTMDVAVYATLSSDVSNGESVIPSLTFAGTTVQSAQSITAGATTGQTITVGAGTFVVANHSSRPAVALNLAGNTIKVGSYEFTSTNEVYTIDQLGVSVASGAQDAIQNVIFKDGSTTLMTTPFNGFYATSSTGVGLVVPANGSKVVDVYLSLGNVGVGAAATGLNVGATLNSYKVLNSVGSTTTAYPATAGNAEYVVKSIPTISTTVSPSAIGNLSGTKTIGQFTVTASGNTVAWKEMLFNYSTSTAVSLSSITMWDGTTQVAGTATLQYATSTIRFVADDEQEVSSSKTYSLKASVGGTTTSGANVTTELAARSTTLGGPAAYTAGLAGAGGSFIWSDKSVTSHGLTTADWYDDYKVVGVGTDSYTLSSTN